jgi:hypothetical protein
MTEQARVEREKLTLALHNNIADTCEVLSKDHGMEITSADMTHALLTVAEGYLFVGSGQKPQKPDVMEMLAGAAIVAEGPAAIARHLVAIQMALVSVQKHFAENPDAEDYTSDFGKMPGDPTWN